MGQLQAVVLRPLHGSRCCIHMQLLAIQLLVLLCWSSISSGGARPAAIGMTAAAAARTLHADATQLPAGSTLYCAVTGECKVCSAKHLKSEACRPTGFAEHLSCWLRQEDVDGPVILVTASRPVSTEHVPMRMPRSCKPAPVPAPNSKTVASLFENKIKAGAGGGEADKASTGTKDASRPNIDGSANSAKAPDGGDGANGTASSSSSYQSKKQRTEHVKLMPDESHYLSTITFEACMLVLLACSLPVVYWRKAKLRRPG